MLTEPWYEVSSSKSADPTPSAWGLWGRSPHVGKGEFGGQCQRFACVNGDAQWLNETDARYYCMTCADAFNAAALRNGEVPMCVLLGERAA
jgi:hypothetical protein